MNNLAKKNIIVLKNVPSNIIEEAIVILKDNKIKSKRKSVEINKFNQNITEEAKEIIYNYANDLEKNKSNENKLIKKNKKLKIIIGILVLIFAIAIYLK
jgi:uncharacterized protein involved in exopolysaccharide biosynthesis